jgi:hypothetical protein
METCTVRESAVVHWSALIVKHDTEQRLFPRALLCDSNVDVLQVDCTLVDGDVTCMVCLTRLHV